MPKEKEPRKRTPPGLRWKKSSCPPTGGKPLAHAALTAALSAGQLEFTPEELDSFSIEGLEWKSYIRIDGTDTYYFPLRPPRKDPPALVVAVGIFILLSVYGFFWSLWKMGFHSYEFFTELDVRSPTGMAWVISTAVFVGYFYYYCFFPEGQLARDAVAQRGGGRVTQDPAAAAKKHD